MSTPLVVSCGGGVNTGGMLVGMAERGIRPDLILYGDTDGDMPETYEFIDKHLRKFTLRHFDLGIVTVTNDGKYGSLEQDCLQNHTLPSLVFGWRSCSDKYKLRPQKKYVKAVYGDQPVRWAIGIDAAEAHRQGAFKDCWHPLVEWGWDRADCVAAIERAGMPVPIKSACYFCPASTKSDVLRLRRNHPELFDRAVAMEQNATKAHTVKGLGRHWSWQELVKADEAQFKMFNDPPAIPCMCFDGDE